MRFRGYRRNDGRIGIRNHVLILPASICASDVAHQVTMQGTGNRKLSQPAGLFTNTERSGMYAADNGRDGCQSQRIWNHHHIAWL